VVATGVNPNRLGKAKRSELLATSERKTQFSSTLRKLCEELVGGSKRMQHEDYIFSYSL
jgi:hypothetical protein